MNAENTRNDKNYAYLSWEDLHRDASVLAKRAKQMGRWKGIVALTRGGMVPACIVAQALGIRWIESLCIASYDEQEQGSVEILSKPDLANGGKDWLVIDDLVDTGQTFSIARGLYPKATLACLYAKPKGREKTDLFISEYEQDVWVHFAWEPPLEKD